MPEMDCPNCRESLGEVEEYPGQTVRCPGCDVASVVVPPQKWGDRVVSWKEICRGLGMGAAVLLVMAYWAVIEKIICVGLVMLLLIAFVAPGRGYSTLRPLNSCVACGHSWFPRGSNYSRRCPHCRVSR